MEAWLLMCILLCTGITSAMYVPPASYAMAGYCFGTNSANSIFDNSCGQFVDVNGDGLVDWTYSVTPDAGKNHYFAIFLNTGSSWCCESTNSGCPASFGLPTCPSPLHPYTSTTEVFTLDQAAHYLQLSREDVAALLSASILRGYRVGDNWRIHREALKTLLLGH